MFISVRVTTIAKIAECCVTWLRWLVGCRLTRKCFRGTSWITKWKFWNPDLPHCLQLVWSSQINWPSGLDATEQQILVGSMRAKIKDEDMLFWNASWTRGPSGPYFSICEQPIPISDRAPFFVCWRGGGRWLVCKLERRAGEVDDLQISCVDYSVRAGDSVGPERTPNKATRIANECILVSGSPFLLHALADDSKWPCLYLCLSLFIRCISAKLWQIASRQMNLAAVHRRSSLWSVNDL